MKKILVFNLFLILTVSLLYSAEINGYNGIKWDTQLTNITGLNEPTEDSDTGCNGCVFHNDLIERAFCVLCGYEPGNIDFIDTSRFKMLLKGDKNTDNYIFRDDRYFSFVTEIKLMSFTETENKLISKYGNFNRTKEFNNDDVDGPKKVTVYIWDKLKTIILLVREDCTYNYGTPETLINICYLSKKGFNDILVEIKKIKNKQKKQSEDEENNINKQKTEEENKL